MAKHQRQNSNRRSRSRGVEKSSYLGERGESFFVRTCGKGDFNVVNLISREDFALLDIFFASEKEARLYADKRNLRIAAFDDNATLASHGQER